ncbi:MAG: lysine--tRNA ligase [Planctomycetes bacterium]|nr:lysine--tRNA ligase [Planctomycetota bacterium]
MSGGKLEQDRASKLAGLREAGVDPFGKRFPDALPVRSVVALAPDEGEGETVRTAGRITAIRGHGKSVFMDIKDWTGKVQVHTSLTQLGEEKFSLCRFLDIGDIIGVDGKVGRTRRGEVTLFVDDLTVLTKALLPFPEKWHGLKDVELRYRQRYLDLIVNDDSMDRFLKRTRIISSIRRFLDEAGFVEVETPMMQKIPGGATAKPFVTHHNTLDIDLYLRISPELYLKRLIVGGMEKVYEINRNFRNEGISTKHNPEFTMMEIYQSYADYNVMAELAEDLITGLVRELYGEECKEVSFGGRALKAVKPFARREYADLLEEHAGVRLGDEEGIRRRAKEAGIDPAGLATDFVANELFEKFVEDNLLDPTFVFNYPRGVCPLTKSCEDDPTRAQRFELFMAGMEVANAYTELNDPDEQHRRFEEQVKQKQEEVKVIDEDFVTAQRYGMPPAGGMGIGIDRLVMLLTDSPSIRDVLLFPLLRPQKETS